MLSLETPANDAMLAVKVCAALECVLHWSVCCTGVCAVLKVIVCDVAMCDVNV